MAEWDAAYVNQLPDSAFAVILPGGTKDETGRTVPRSLRKLPHHDASGKVDMAHLRNALSREPQTDMSSTMHAKASAHLDAHMNAGKALVAVKAAPLDDDAVRLLAFPFTGPIPYPGTRGVDLDNQWFSERTDIKRDWLPFRPVDWHHGADPTGRMGRAVFGKAIDIGGFDGASKEPDEDGWWVTVWLDYGQRRLDLIRRLAERNAAIFGSSETVRGLATVRTAKGEIPWAPRLPGEIASWPYWRQTLSTSPQNTHSILRPMKATLDEIEAAGERPDESFWSDLEDALSDLGTNLRVTSGMGDHGAKSGHDSLRSELDRLVAAMDRVRTAITPPMT